MSSNKTSEFLIQYTGLKLGEHDFEFQLTDEFFEEAAHFGLSNAKIVAKAKLNKEETFMEWHFSTKGTAIGDCDLCGDELNLTLEGEQRLMVKYGEEEKELDGELVVIPYDSYHFDLKHHIMDCVLLNLPMRRVHAEGDCNQETLEELEKLRYKEDISDPRWEGLQKLNINKQNNGTS